jgi:hypothetical protein
MPGGLVGYELPAVVRSCLIRSKIPSRDVPRRIDSDSNVGTIHTKDRHDNVMTNPNGVANSPRE